MSSSADQPLGGDELDADPDRSGETLAQRYRLLRQLGQGGMGEVYLAKHLLLDKEVAIKILADSRAVPRAAERFFREARATAGIAHPNIVDITDFGQADSGEVFIVMEYLQGEDLSDLVYREGRLPWPRVRGICEQICAALQAAHEQGIVHRDLKPENCFRIERGANPDFIKVLDFGIAKLTGRGGQQRRRLTNTGAIFGTVEYMAPEQARGKSVDHRIDIYALGVIAYELLTGQVPFDGDEWMEIAFKHANDPLDPPSSLLPPGELPPAVDTVLGRALAKNPEDRYPTMDAFARALRSVDRGDMTVVAPAPSGPFPIVPAAAVGYARPPESTGPFEVAGQASAPMDVSVSLGVESGEATPPPAVPPAAWISGIVVAAALAAGVAYWLAGSAAEQTPETTSSVPQDAFGAKGRPAAASGRRDTATDTTPAVVAGSSGTTTAADAGDDSVPVADASIPSRPAAAPGLSRAQIDAAFDKARVKLMACRGSIFGGKAGDRVRVQLTVRGRDGKVIGARPTGTHAKTKLGGCVAAELRKLQFPAFERPKHRFSRVVRL